MKMVIVEYVCKVNNHKSFTIYYCKVWVIIEFISCVNNACLWYVCK